MLETPEQRIELLKAGFSLKEIERLYIEQNNFRIIQLPILYELTKFNGVNMKTLDIKQLDKKDEQIADVLISLGMSRNAALTLAFMQNANSATSLDIEKAARLRQPEVSIAMRHLKEHDWINERDEKKSGKGRPYKIYSLKIRFADIIAQLENQQKKAVDETQAKIERLKELGK